MKLSRLYGGLAIACLLGGVGLLFVSSITIGVPAGNQVLASIWITFGFALLGLLSAIAMERATFVNPMGIALFVGAIAWAWWLSVIWLVVPVVLPWLSVPITLTVTAGFAGFAAAMHLLHIADRRFRRVRAATVAAAGVFAACLAGGFAWWLAAGIDLPLRQRRTIEEVLIRTGGVMVTIVGCGVLTVIAAVLIPRLARGGDVADVERVDLTITCPRCAQRQQIRTHGDACARCGLQIRVTPI